MFQQNEKTKKGEKIIIRLKKIKTKSDEYVSVYYNANGYSGSIPCHDTLIKKQVIADPALLNIYITQLFFFAFYQVRFCDLDQAFVQEQGSTLKLPTDDGF